MGSTPAVYFELSLWSHIPGQLNKVFLLPKGKTYIDYLMSNELYSYRNCANYKMSQRQCSRNGCRGNENRSSGLPLVRKWSWKILHGQGKVRELYSESWKIGVLKRSQGKLKFYHGAKKKSELPDRST